jgi:hypothetical protein
VMHERFVEFFGALAMPYSTAMRTFRETCWAPFEEGSENFGERPANLKHNAWILGMLERNPNAPVREIAHETRTPNFIVVSVWCVCLTCYGRTCVLVPHSLMILQKENVLKHKSTTFSSHQRDTASLAILLVLYES